MIPKKLKVNTILMFVFAVIFSALYFTLVTIDLNSYYTIYMEYAIRNHISISNAFPILTYGELAILIAGVVNAIIGIIKTAKGVQTARIAVHKVGATGNIFAAVFLNVLRNFFLNNYELSVRITNIILLISLGIGLIICSIGESFAKKDRYRMSPIFDLSTIFLLVIMSISFLVLASGPYFVPLYLFLSLFLTAYVIFSVISSVMFIRYKPIKNETLIAPIEIKEEINEPIEQVDPAEKLKELKDLLDKGVITLEEYEEARKKYVDML